LICVFCPIVNNQAVLAMPLQPTRREQGFNQLIGVPIPADVPGYPLVWPLPDIPTSGVILRAVPEGF
jgi:hypothetical protein